MNSRAKPLLLLTGFGSWILLAVSMAVLRSDRIDDIANPTLIANATLVGAIGMALIATGLLIAKSKELRLLSAPLLSGVAGLTLVLVLAALATLKAVQ
jgi:hypothetical protein